jgi:hypothetical protein
VITNQKTKAITNSTEQRVLLEKMILCATSQVIPPLSTEAKGSLPCSKEFTLSPYPKPDESNPQPKQYILKSVINHDM